MHIVLKMKLEFERTERERQIVGNVILIGFMGCGKSSAAVKLSYRLKQPMTDTDRWIEKKQGRKITEIFEKDGEEAFRDMETECLKTLKESAKNQIISVGGGAVLREENRRLLKETGKVIYLRAKPETLYERLKNDNARPLLKAENPLERIQKLLEERKEVYENAADIVIDVDDKNFGQILYEIERSLRPVSAFSQNATHNRNLEASTGERRFERSFGKNFERDSRRDFRQNRFQNRFGANQNQTGAAERGNLYGEVLLPGQLPGIGRTSRFVTDGAEKEKVFPAVEREMAEPAVKENTLPAADNEKAVSAGNEKETVPVLTVPVLAEEKQETPKKQLRKLLVINGPNINFLGIREKGVYGTQDYYDLLFLIAKKGVERNAAIEVFQSNHEGDIIDRIQRAYFDGTEGIVINPGAYTHYSYAIRDALASIRVPKVEIHISNIMEREAFRHVSVTAAVCDKQIYGHGTDGYLEAIDFILDK